MRRFTLCTMIFSLLLLSCTNHSAERGIAAPNEEVYEAIDMVEVADEAYITETDDYSTYKVAELEVSEVHNFVGKQKLAFPVNAAVQNPGQAVTTPAPVADVRAGRKIIYKAEVEMTVEENDAAYESLRTLVAAHGGYLADETRAANDYVIERRLVIRVPAAQFDPLLSGAVGLANKVEHKRIYTQDVSEEFVDIQARLKNKYASEQRYREILKKAKTIEDILAVEEKLRRIREEIEAREGRLRYLKDQVGMSTITLKMIQRLPYTYQPEERAGFGAQLLDSLDAGWGGLLVFIVGTVRAWPFLLLMTIVIMLTRRAWKRRKALKSSTEY